uniref:Putative heterotrimeric G protein beta subunit n=1 Tax=Physcomitrium patens TaxID=3218 RepID=Q8GU43_PHYPA|nr:putative heterotrimeric G protein beta subunit [Physcomitrium patens]
MSVADSVRERYEVSKAEVQSLREQLHEKRASLLDTDGGPFIPADFVVVISFVFMVCVRTLQGHTGKIYSLDWAYRETSRIVSASQDGRLIVWNAISSQKTYSLKLACAWVKAAAISPGGNTVACGGLDNVCSIFNLSSVPDKEGNLPVSGTLAGHTGYLSSCKYMPTQEKHIVTSSGDHTCRFWDVETQCCIAVFGGDILTGHTGDVMSVSVSSSSPHVFISGSCDKSAKLWDVRTPARAQRTFYGHEGDVNTVNFLSEGRHFGTGSDDGSCRLFDIGTGHELQQYWDKQALARGPVNVTSVAFSRSGRLLFAGYSNGNCYVWDTLLAKVVANLGGGRDDGHTNRVSCLGLAADGDALCTGSYDATLKVWSCAGKKS